MRLPRQLRQLIIFRESRQNRCVFGRPKRATLGNFNRVFQRFRQIGKQRAHFFRRFQAMLWGQTAAIFLVNVTSFGNTNQRVMGAIVICRSKIGLISGY